MRHMDCVILCSGAVCLVVNSWMLLPTWEMVYNLTNTGQHCLNECDNELLLMRKWFFIPCKKKKKKKIPGNLFTESVVLYRESLEIISIRFIFTETNCPCHVICTLHIFTHKFVVLSIICVSYWSNQNFITKGINSCLITGDSPWLNWLSQLNNCSIFMPHYKYGQGIWSWSCSSPVFPSLHPPVYSSITCYV
jgi:hypothetical protein